MSRPELIAPPEMIYDEEGADNYMRNSRMMYIQTKLSMRAIELLNLPDDVSCLMLDIGCGAGLSGQALEQKGHRFIGTDISRDMINVAQRREVEGDMLQHDMGLGLPFRAGSFDGAISVSAIQWLCNADRKEHIPQLRLKKFFDSLYMVLRRGAKAVLQFYPANVHQSNMIVHAATRSGFSGGLVVDYPHSTRAKKYFLVLSTGPQSELANVKAKTGMETDSEDEDMDSDDEECEEDEDYDDDDSLSDYISNDSPDRVSMAGSRKTAGTSRTKAKRKVQMRESEKKGGKLKRRKTAKHTREWIMEKKEKQAKKGVNVRANTKYTGRRRGPKF
eukprot:TRINITY_DN2959_c1_g1_i1.p2 TRINITY_DN2959_c1_g1~~TRINITY_DN2959_c1_g1_i1.p2  ORF type:complete len:332 (+),score=69.06 TRINITY_DN2959_c1_g1_i1:553-1548(+)